MLFNNATHNIAYEYTAILLWERQTLIALYTWFLYRPVITVINNDLI